MIDARSIATRALRKGDAVVHPDYGSAVVMKTEKRTGATWIKFDSDGLVGTCSAEILSWKHPRSPT